MNTRIIHALGLFLFASIFAGAATAFADKASILASMKARRDKVTALKDAGTVGEGVAGLLLARSGLDAEGTKLIAADNADRKALFALMAKQKGIPPVEVGKVMAKGFFSRGKPGHWFRDSKGKWKQK